MARVLFLIAVGWLALSLNASAFGYQTFACTWMITTAETRQGAATITKTLRRRFGRAGIQATVRVADNAIAIRCTSCSVLEIRELSGEGRVTLKALPSGDIYSSPHPIKSASATVDLAGNPEVHFTVENAAAFHMFTLHHLNQQMAIIVDGHTVASPTIEQPMYGEGEIVGPYSARETRIMAAILSVPGGPLLRRRRVGRCH